MTIEYEEEDAHRQRANVFFRRLALRRMKVTVEEGKEPLSASEMLADIVVRNVLPAGIRRRIRTRPLTAIVGVPTAQWVAPVADALQALAGDGGRVVVVRREAVQKDRSMPGLVDRLAEGLPVFGVSHVPDAALPPLLLNVAEHRFVVPRFSSGVVLEVLRRTQKGHLPAGAADLDYGVLDFEEICSLLPSGGRAKETVRRMAEIIASRTRVGSRTDQLPRLEEALEYGEARTWALNLRDDLRDLRDKKIEARDVDKGAILYGPPGTGKTLLGRMIGEACGIPTVVGSVGELFAASSGYLDGVIKAQRALFREAIEKNPSILFLDEINALPNVDTLDRRNRDFWLPVITDFYTLLDGAMNERSGVIVIGATNRIEDINPAILRPGRLERALYVGPPDAIGVERILRHHLVRDLVDADLSKVAAMASAARSTGAVLEEKVRAARRSARRAGRAMSADDLERQIAPKDKRSASDIRRVAVHEAGHVLAVHALALGEVRSASTVSTGDSGGAIEFLARNGLLTRSQTYDQVKCLLAGRAAEEAILGEPSQGAGGTDDSDLAQATSMIGTMFMSTGLEDTLVYRGDAARLTELIGYDAELRRRIDEVLRRLLTEVHQLLQARRAELERLADALAERRFLTGEDIKDLLEPMAAPLEVDAKRWEGDAEGDAAGIALPAGRPE